jgi:hypothetical protein
MYLSLRYPTPKQGMIWLRRRQKIRPSDIAKEFNVSRPFISKSQRIAEGRIGELLQHTASVNRINIRHQSTRYGLAVGYCPAHKMDSYILYSPKIGVQVWFDHSGECGNCSERSQCEKTLRTLAREWEVSLEKGQPPAELAGNLFDAIMRRLGWKV